MYVTGDSNIGRRINLVWECEQCKKLENVKWVDDETNKYGIFTFNFGYHVTTIQAKKIVIDLQALVIYINPIDIYDETETECTSLSTVT